MTGRLGALLLCLTILGCDGEDPTDAGADAALSDAGADAAIPSDGGADASVDAGGDAPPGDVVAEGLCDTSGALAVAPDGSRVAFVTCSADRAVWLAQLPTGEPVRVADANANTTVLLSPDAAWLVWGDTSGWSMQDVSMTAAPIGVAAGTVDEVRFVTVDPDGAPILRLLTLASDGPTRRVTMRGDEDLFFGSMTLIENSDLRGSLALVSGSRGTLIVETLRAGTRTYELVPTGGGGTPTTLPIDPDTFVMGPVGMGDTHGIARRGAGLSFVEFASGAEIALETDGVPASSPLHVIEDPTDGRYAYYLRQGDPTRRLRNGSGPSQRLVDADAMDFWVTPDEALLVFASGGRAFTATLDGGSTADLGPHAAAVLDGAMAPSSAELALIDAGAIVRFVPGRDASGTALDGTGVVAQSAAYDGAGERLLWQRDGDDDGRRDVLRSAGLGVPSARTVAWDVHRWWPVPTQTLLLYRTTSGALLRL